jgi:hypothetical protein
MGRAETAIEPRSVFSSEGKLKTPRRRYYSAQLCPELDVPSGMTVSGELVVSAVVRFGSLADILRHPCHVRFTPDAELPCEKVCISTMCQENPDKMRCRRHGRTPMMMPSDRYGPRGFFLSKAGQLTLFGAAIVVLLVFALSYVC